MDILDSVTSYALLVSGLLLILTGLITSFKAGIEVSSLFVSMGLLSWAVFYLHHIAHSLENINMKGGKK